MPCRDKILRNERFHLVRKLEKPHGIGNRRTSLADAFRHFLLSKAEIVLQRLVGDRFLNGVEIFALNVFGCRHRGGRKIIRLDKSDANLFPSKELCSSQATLS